MAIKGEKRRLGAYGEALAAAYLKKHGYKIIKRNYKCPLGEVDIIAAKDDVVAFTEVKTRTSDYFGLPNEAVDKKRQQRYKNCVKYYFSGREIDVTVRFDIVEVFVAPGGVEINHIENAFY